MEKRLQSISGNSFLYIWKFKVHPDKGMEFQRIYGPEGEWVLLFKQGEGYIQTLLLKDLEMPGTYTTIDLWESEAAYQIFKKKFAAEFEALDNYCENLTESEVLVGRFETL